MNNLFRKTRDAILTKQNGIISSSIIIASMMIAARIFGFARYRVLNGFFTKEELDLFYAAFRVPDFVFEILITGALTTTFIPFYLKYAKDTKKQSEFTSSLINFISLALFAFIGVLFILMPIIVRYMTPGFSDEAFAQITFLSRLILVGQLPFLVFGNFLTGLSQANKMFLIPAFAPVLYNVSIVLFTYYMAPSIGLYSTVLGVIFGAILLFLCQLVILQRLDFVYSFTFRYLSDVLSFFRQIVPRLLTVLATQIEATIDLALASLLTQGSYTIFYLAQHLQLLPVSIIGISIGQASMPYLTEMYQGKKLDELKNVIVDSLNNILFLTVPIAGFFIVNRTPIVRLVYGASKFDWEATVLTALTMSYFCISLPFHSIYYFLTRCFYAAMDNKTPFLVSIVAIIFNSILSLLAITVFRLPVWSLGLTFSITIVLQVTALLVIYSYKVHSLSIGLLMKETTKVVTAGSLASLVAYDSRKLFDGLIFDTSRTLNLFFLMCITFGIMMVTYVFAVWTLDSRGLFVITKAIIGIKKMPRKIMTFFSPVEA